MRNLHLQLAHTLWEKHLPSGAIVLDCTLGNGHDFLTLLDLCYQKNALHAIGLDIQKQALINTQTRIQNHPFNTYTLLELSHEFLEALPHQSFDLIIYNLGYLPGGDKSITTSSNSTLISLKKALNLLSPNGAISLTLYPGHPEGQRELELIVEFLKEEATPYWALNQPNSPLSPQLFWIKKTKTT